jgi:hypothetical protein
VTNQTKGLLDICNKLDLSWATSGGERTLQGILAHAALLQSRDYNIAPCLLANRLRKKRALVVMSVDEIDIIAAATVLCRKDKSVHSNDIRDFYGLLTELS